MFFTHRKVSTRLLMSAKVCSLSGSWRTRPRRHELSRNSKSRGLRQFPRTHRDNFCTFLYSPTSGWCRTIRSNLCTSTPIGDCKNNNWIDVESSRHNSHVLLCWSFARENAMKSRQCAVDMNCPDTEVECRDEWQVVETNCAMNLLLLNCNCASAILEETVDEAMRNFLD